MPKRNPIVHMLVPGRRALGEDWSKVSIFANENGGYDVERENTPAPAAKMPIFVPGLGNESYEAVDFILEYKRKDQEYRVSHGLSAKRYSQADFEKMFHDWMELKKKRFKGQTQSGPAVTFQREKP